jgi:hypothetical protein
VLKNNEAQAAVGRYNVQKFNECIEAPGGRSDCHDARGRIDFAARAGGALDTARAFRFYRPPRLLRGARGSSLVAHGASLRHLIPHWGPAQVSPLRAWRLEDHSFRTYMHAPPCCEPVP